MFNISRWQIFERETGKTIICKRCGSMWFTEDKDGQSDEWSELPGHCPNCKAFMLTDRKWFSKKG